MHLVYIRRMEEVQAAIRETAAERPALLAHHHRYSDPTLGRFAPAFRLVMNGKMQEAIDEIQLQIARSMVKPQDATVYMMLGTAYRSAGNTADAIEAYKSAVSYDPSLEKAWYALQALKQQTPEAAPTRLAAGWPELLPVLNCGNPVSWPRFAVLGCAAAYIRYADRLEGDGSASTASR